MDTENIFQKGTTTVGIVCKDGIVLAADRRATAGNLIVNKRTEKVQLINDNMAITMAGTVSDAQLLTKLIRAETTLKKIRSGREPNVKETANLLANMVYGNIRKFSIIPGIAHFLMGGKDDEGFHIYDIFADGSITEVDDYITSGSGSVMAYGVLETLFKKDMSIDDGVKLAAKCINAAMQRDTYSGNGIDVVTITKDGLKKVLSKDLTPVLEI
ncbi:proteasome subunit beta [Candidatus Woesearchaeota archaeon]|nr:proteasome subunit beta [Candidatus Woesearchaeota archaeon]